MLKQTINTLIISILLTIISIGGYFSAVVYVSGMGSDLSDMHIQSNDLKKEEDSLNSIKRVAQNADQRNLELSRYVVPVENEGSIKFIQTVEGLADSYGLNSNTNSIEIVSEDRLSKLNKEYLSIRETLSGPESTIARFVEKIETLPFNTKIRSYSIAKIGGSKGTSSIQQLDLEILVIKEK